MRLLLISLTLFLTSSAVGADTIAGRASIIDADTLEIHGQRIRILDVDAPESDQPCIRPDGTQWRCGQQAAFALADWIDAVTVICEATDKDRLRRWLAHCTVSNSDIGLWLAVNGWAVPYRDCACELVRDAAKMAKMAGLNIWSGSFMMPWDWRAKHKNGN